jgi:Putative prokaryotic signal transducing protein
MATAGTTEVPNPNEELVKVFDSEQESEVMVVRGLLESAGIECATSNLDAPQDILPGVGGVILLVRREDAEQALRLIEENRKAGTLAAEEAELNGEQEPPQINDEQAPPEEA